MRLLATSLCLVLSLALPATAQHMPSGSRPRAERHAGWRSLLDDGERAMTERNWDAAESAFVSVIDDARTAGDRGLLLARALDGLADLRREIGRLQEAGELYLESADLLERVLGSRQPRLALTLHNLGVVYVEQERFDEAEAPLERALLIFEEAMGADSPQAASTRQVLDVLESRRRD
jgi:tetratricopeptide (TPR) repeat protein